MPIHKVFIHSNDTKNCNYVLQHQISKVTFVRITNVKLPLTKLTIDSKNNTLEYKIGNNNQTIGVVIPQGFYDTSSLVQKLNTTFIDGTIASYSDQSKKITFTNPNGNVIIQTTGTMQDLIGYPSGGNTPTALADLSHPIMYIESVNLNLDAEIGSLHHSILYESETNLSGHFFQDKNLNDTPFQLVHPTNVSQLKFRITDKSMNPIDLQGVSFSFCVELYY